MLEPAGYLAVGLFRSQRNIIAGFALVTICGSLGLAELRLSQTIFPLRQSDPHHAQSAAGYVGSKSCAKCHGEIYQTYSQTEMGRSMSEMNASLLAKIPNSASMFDRHLNRHFETYPRNGGLYQSEYETTDDGKEVFRDTHKIEWIMGSGANGWSAIVRRGDYLFQAPLSFYSSAKTWGLSPGYEFGDYGFSRPILPACIVCHSGQPQPVLDGDGRFRQPPFLELAIGCENCHGPGARHVIEMQVHSSVEAAAGSIVNPARLTPWLADNICMSCHQTGQARVLQAGKQFSDFRPGAALSDTLSIFLVPFGRQSPPQDDLLEHYLSMRLSKCYRSSDGQLSCISCHDPHVQPTEQQAPAYYRGKCVSCHAARGCALALAVRQQKNPPDDCIGCHMPKRNVQVIAHSVLTNHRIVVTPDEPFPDAAFHMTTPGLPDLVHLNAKPGSMDVPSPLTLLEAYRQVMVSRPDYRERYWSLASQLQTSNPENIFVLEALADLSLQKKNVEGMSAATGYLDRARNLGSTKPSDFERLARLLVAARQQAKAADVLRQGIDLIPYDAELYRLLARINLSLGRARDACEVLAHANHIFPQDTDIRSLLKECAATGAAPLER